MRICLINAAAGAEFTDPVEFKAGVVRQVTCRPQLGVLTLASILEAGGCVPKLVDLNRLFYNYARTLEGQRLHDFAALAAAEIAAHDADVYGFSTLCSAYPLTVRIAKSVRALRPESCIVFGGPQASVVSDQTLQAFPFVDFVLRGEADVNLMLLLEEFSGGRKFDRVPGLTHRSPFGIQQNPDGAPIPDLDILPAPAYHLTDELRGATQASLELGRGCPFACTFCSTNDFFRRKFRLRSPERVLADMRAIEVEYGIRNFDLVHDMFTVDRKRVVAFCQTLMASGEGYTWSCSARTDCVDEELIELMAAAGCESVFFGVETGSERMQKIIDKHLDTKRAHDVIDLVERAGMDSTVSLITGFPQETPEDLSATLDMFMHSTRTSLSSPQLNVLAPLANTPLHREFKHLMTLDELCSDISHQGRHQHEDDKELIRKYPDIFPNFYLLPTYHLERAMLLELREFLLMAQLRFRWLLAAVDQASTSFLEFCLEWMRSRQAVYPPMSGPDLRHYYRTPQFSRDFTQFLRGHAVGDSPLVSIFLDFEDAIHDASGPSVLSTSLPAPLEEQEPLDWSDIPVRTENSRVICLRTDLGEAIEAVRKRQKADERPEPQWYVAPQNPDIESFVRHVSRKIAIIIDACDGSRTMSQVVNSFTAAEMEVEDSVKDYTIYRLILKAREEGLLAIFRKTADAAASQGTKPLALEYEAISASASQQNQFSAQAI